jgi:3-hydroxyisobutyrate dehydrogenase-like beta-hydroxyacid dehydrogenase
MRIGIIGVGAMGGQMALNLVRAGHEVTVWNRSSEAVKALVGRGAKRAATVAETFQGEVALSVLYDDAAIQTVLLGSGALEQASHKCIHVCMSTISVTLAHELVKVHEKLGLPYVAAPVLGRPEVIEQKGLNILMAGEAPLLDALETPFANLGKTWRMGSEPVQAQVAKLAANFMISGALQAMAEAAAVLETHGADPGRFLSIMTDSLFSAPVYRSYSALIRERVTVVPSELGLVVKDNNFFLSAVQGTNLQLRMAEAIRSSLTQAVASGAGQSWSTALTQVARAEDDPA